MSILIEKHQLTDTFYRRQLKMIEGVPADKLESVVEEIEIITSMRYLMKLFKVICSIHCVILATLTVFIIHGFFVTKVENAELVLKGFQNEHRNNLTISNEMDKWIAQNQEWLQDYFDETWKTSYKSLTDEQIENYKLKIKEIFNELYIQDHPPETTTKYVEVKTLDMVSRLILDLRKHNLFKYSMYMIFFMFPLIYYLSIMYIRNHKSNNFNNACAYLNIENETYFCKLGYYWSIDEKMESLKLSKINIRGNKRRPQKKVSKERLKNDFTNQKQSARKVTTTYVPHYPTQIHEHFKCRPGSWMNYQKMYGHRDTNNRVQGNHMFSPQYFINNMINTQTNFNHYNRHFYINTNHGYLPPHGQSRQDDHMHNQPNVCDHADMPEIEKTEVFTETFCKDSTPEPDASLRKRPQTVNKSRKPDNRVNTYAFTERSNSHLN